MFTVKNRNQPLFFSKQCFHIIFLLWKEHFARPLSKIYFFNPFSLSSSSFSHYTIILSEISKLFTYSANLTQILLFVDPLFLKYLHIYPLFSRFLSKSPYPVLWLFFLSSSRTAFLNDGDIERESR